MTDPMGTPLTADEIRALPDGTEVVVIWSGGNGPHRYTVAHHWDEVVAQTTWEREHDHFDHDGKSLSEFVGQERVHNRVWLPETGTLPTTGNLARPLGGESTMTERTES